jgi:hypothetical protein
MPALASVSKNPYLKNNKIRVGMEEKETKKNFLRVQDVQGITFIGCHPI